MNHEERNGYATIIFQKKDLYPESTSYEKLTN